MNVNLTGLRKGAVLGQLLCFARDSSATANIAYTLVVFLVPGTGIEPVRISLSDGF